MVGTFRVEFDEVGTFAAAENLEAVPREGFVEAGKRQSRSIEVGDSYRATQPGPARDAFEAEGVLLLEVEIDKIQDAERFRFVSYHDIQCTTNGRQGKSAGRDAPASLYFTSFSGSSLFPW